MRRLVFHFDFISPFAYLAWTQIHKLAARHEAELEPVPTLFAALLAEGKTRGPAEIPAKRRYFFRDAFRTAHLLGVPIAMPPSHPFNPLLGLRIASLPLAREERAKVITALFDAIWAGGGGVETEDRMSSVLDAAGLDGPSLVARAPQAKETLRRATDEAIAHHVFGVPTMRVIEGAEEELFWGVDSFGHLERYLTGQDPLRGQDLEQLLERPASANRRP
jgi:2-hydroxychromene-2-carboxylate isomerase